MNLPDNYTTKFSVAQKQGKVKTRMNCAIIDEIAKIKALVTDRIKTEKLVISILEEYVVRQL